MKLDEAKKLGLRKYRELYPAGRIPLEVEKEANLTVGQSRECYFVIVTFSLRNKPEPYVLFRAAINKQTGEVNVLEAAPSLPLNSVEDLDLKSDAQLREDPNDKPHQA